MGGALPSTHDLATLAIAAVVVGALTAQIAMTFRGRRGSAHADASIPAVVWGGWIAAACSIGAALIHLAVIEDHLHEYPPFGVAFALLAVFQLAWPLAYLPRPSRSLALAAVVVNLGTALVWLWSRTIGLPVGPDPGLAVALGPADLASTVLEVMLAIALLPAVLARRHAASGRDAGERGLQPRTAATIVGATSGIVAVLTALGLFSLVVPI
jgi:hypothetical protein